VRIHLYIFPNFAVEPSFSQLLDWLIVGRSRIQGYPRQQKRYRKVVQARGMPHDILARQIVLALLEQTDHCCRILIACGYKGVLPISVGVVFLYPIKIFLISGSSFHLGSVGSFAKLPDKIPIEFSSPAGSRTPEMDWDV